MAPVMKTLLFCTCNACSGLAGEIDGVFPSAIGAIVASGKSFNPDSDGTLRSGSLLKPSFLANKLGSK